MPLQLLPMGIDDLVHYEDLIVAAFADSLQSVFYPGGFSPEAKAHTIQHEEQLWRSTAADVAARGTSDAVSLQYMKVVDTDLGPDAAPIGVSKWMVYPRRRTEAELAAEDAEAAEAAGRPLPPGMNAAALHSFQRVLRQAKRDIFGPDPYIILHVLVTHPAHHRRGVGALHLKWGQDRADELGLPLYLEASAMGKPLYERWGYRAVRKLPFDAREFGAQHAMTHVAMVRPAHGAAAKEA